MGHCRDSGAEVSATRVDRPHKSVRVYPRDYMGVFHHVSLRPFGTIGTVQSWCGDVASCRGGCGPTTLARVRSLRICLEEVCSFPHLAYLLGWVLVVRPTLQTCSAGTGSVALPRRLARRGLIHSPCLKELLGGGSLVRFVSQTCLVGAWSFAPPRILARRGLGRSPRLLDLLDRGSFVRPTSQNCSARTRLFASQTCLVGLGHSPHLADLLGEDLVGKWAKERFMGLALGTPFLGTRQAHLESLLLSSTQGTMSFNFPT
jgi:hypothetical protein